MQSSSGSDALRLDPVRRNALEGDERIALTAREFRLLEALMEAEGEVCSRHDLAEVVWGGSVPGGPQLVDEYVGRLRGKLGDEVIEEVGESGYRTRNRVTARQHAQNSSESFANSQPEPPLSAG